MLWFTISACQKPSFHTKNLYSHKDKYDNGEKSGTAKIPSSCANSVREKKIAQKKINSNKNKIHHHHCRYLLRNRIPHTASETCRFLAFMEYYHDTTQLW